MAVDDKSFGPLPLRDPFPLRIITNPSEKRPINALLFLENYGALRKFSNGTSVEVSITVSFRRNLDDKIPK